MKTNYFLLLGLFCFLAPALISCGDGDDGPNEERKSLVGTWSAGSGDGGNTLYFSFKENGECTYDEVSYYNDYEIARAYFNYSYNAEDEILVLTLKYIEDPELHFVWITEEPGEKEEWEMRILSDDKFIIPHIFRDGAVFTRM